MTKFVHFNMSHYGNMSKAPQKIKKLYQSRTVAANPLGRQEIYGLAAQHIGNPGETVAMVKVGVAMLHPNDRYERKVGREQAVKNMQLLPLTVVGVVSTQTHVFVRLAPVKGIQLSLRLNKASGFCTVTGSLVTLEKSLAGE